MSSRFANWLGWFLMALPAVLLLLAFANRYPSYFLMGLYILGVAAVGYVALHVAPAYTLCAGLTMSMFSGNWQYMGLPSLVAPDRVVLLLGLGVLILRVGPGRDRPDFRLRWTHLIMGVLILYILVNSAWAGSLGDRSPMFTVVDRVGITPFLLFAIAPVAFYTDRHRQVLLITLTVIGAYLGFTGLMESLHLKPLVFPRYINDPSIGLHSDRARGPFLEAEGQGLAIAGSAIAAIVASRLWTAPRAVWFARAVAVLCIIGAFLTLARAVWVGVVLAGVVTLMTTRELRRYVVPVSVATVASLVVALTFIPGLQQRVSDRVGSKSKVSVYDRRNQQNTALRMISVKPLQGFGWDRYRKDNEPYLRASPDYPLTGTTNGRVQIVHNVFLSFGAELGLIGLLLWLSAIAGSSLSAFRPTRDPTIRAWQISYRAFLLLTLVVALFTPLLKTYTASLLFLWAGVLQGLVEPEPDSEPIDDPLPVPSEQAREREYVAG